MAVRLPRLRLPGIPQHVVIRGNNGQTIFHCDHDRRVCLDYLAEASIKYDCQIHAYILMPNHIHLLATPVDAMGVSQTIQLLARQYVQFFNKQYGRRGTLWEGRYKSALVDGDVYALDCYRYIESNPVRNHLCDTPGDYPWSSYHVNGLPASDNIVTLDSARKEKIDTLIQPHPAYLALGDNELQRREKYAALCAHEIDPGIASFIRRETNRSRVLGDEEFMHKIEGLLGVDLSCKPRGGDHRSSAFKYA